MKILNDYQAEIVAYLFKAHVIIYLLYDSPVKRNKHQKIGILEIFKNFRSVEAEVYRNKGVFNTGNVYIVNLGNFSAYPTISTRH